VTDPRAAPAPFLGAVDAATELTHLAQAFEHGFRVLGDPAAAGEAPARRIALATASRVLGEHAAGFAALVPESVLLADARAAGAARPVELPGDARGLVEALDLLVASLADRAAPVADGALRRHAARVRSDLAAIVRDLDERVLGG
jgi:hypothetical protein